jgi:UDP-N-acetylglucosamine--N-acetylmuramyl-(pentapeptide) pyrophosphoryl-undecaprenol N-acetylglucosamine transferase
MKQWITEKGEKSPFQVIWQSGKGYAAGIESFFEGLPKAKIEPNSRTWCNIHNCDFISRMDLAYAAADLIVSRAGAGTISELCAAGKAPIFVPSPVVAEDHQTHNAMALVDKGAALLVKDDQAIQRLMAEVENVIFDKIKIKELETNILALAKPNASSDIACEVLKLAK